MFGFGSRDSKTITVINKGINRTQFINPVSVDSDGFVRVGNKRIVHITDENGNIYDLLGQPWDFALIPNDAVYVKFYAEIGWSKRDDLFNRNPLTTLLAMPNQTAVTFGSILAGEVSRVRFVDIFGDSVVSGIVTNGNANVTNYDIAEIGDFMNRQRAVNSRRSVKRDTNRIAKGIAVHLDMNSLYRPTAGDRDRVARAAFACSKLGYGNKPILSEKRVYLPGYKGLLFFARA